MKVWIKLLVGTGLGIAVAVFVPGDLAGVFGWLQGFVLQIGRYALVPLMFFSLTIGIHQLRKEGQFWGLFLRNLALMFAVSVVVILVGLVTALAFLRLRIPIRPEEEAGIAGLDIPGGILEVFPSNMFAALSGDGSFLLPIYVFAFFLGMALAYDNAHGRPIAALVDSLSRVFFRVASFFIDISGLCLIALSAYWMIRFRSALQLGFFTSLMAILVLLTLILAFVVAPLCLYLIRPKTKPWKALYGSLGPAIASFFSGDMNFSLLILVGHSKEMGIRRRASALTLAMFSTFCRAGSAMVAAVAFIVVFNSYSFINITFAEIVSVGLASLGISFLLARHSGDGAYVALAVLCLGFGRFQEGYLLLRPVAFFLVGVGTLLDLMIASFANYAMARIGGLENGPS
ncbi:MAG: dicarboxylate/amino acid:cation symporter [Treponema sp.]|nr:dicarboxylate/amino acid:cation symporter [Treponema sp.]